MLLRAVCGLLSSGGSSFCSTRYTTPEVAANTATNTITVMAIQTPVLVRRVVVPKPKEEL